MAGLQAEYDREVKAYLDANGLKACDLKPKVRMKKETKKQQAQTAGEIRPPVTQNQQPWPVSAATTWPASTPADDLLVYHVRADGTRECYVQRGVAGMKAAGGGRDEAAERQMLLSTLADHTRNVTQLRLQLVNARARVVELEQQNQLLRQLLRDAQLPAR